MKSLPEAQFGTASIESVPKGFRSAQSPRLEPNFDLINQAAGQAIGPLGVAQPIEEFLDKAWIGNLKPLRIKVRVKAVAIETYASNIAGAKAIRPFSNIGIVI